MNKEMRTRKALSKIVDPETKRRKTKEFQSIASTMHGDQKAVAIKNLATELKKQQE